MGADNEIDFAEREEAVPLERPESQKPAESDTQVPPYKEPYKDREITNPSAQVEKEKPEPQKPNP